MLAVCTSNFDHTSGEPCPYVNVGWVYKYQELSKNEHGVSQGMVMLRRTARDNLPALINGMLAIGVGDEITCHFSKLKFKIVGEGNET